MKIGVPKEILDGEHRVALVPTQVRALIKSGFEVTVEQGAGIGAHLSDGEFQNAGANIEKSAASLYQNSDLILKVRNLIDSEIDLVKEGAVLISLMDAYFYLETVEKIAKRKITSFALEFIPRITRAQSMDVLSSMASIAGYRAVIQAASELPKYFPMLMTAAGTVKPSKIFVIGAGVAGLMAIATAKRLGAVVEAYDTRSACREQVESLGAKFIDFKLEDEDAEDSGGYAKEKSEEFYSKQRLEMAKKVAESDVVITTAAIPGKRSPVLITDDMLKGMQTGSVIVDLAAERGGNVEGTVKNEKVSKYGVTIIGYIDHPARVPSHASQLFSKNISTFLLNMAKEGQINLNMEDEIISKTIVTHEGNVVHEGLKKIIT